MPDEPSTPSAQHTVPPVRTSTAGPYSPPTVTCRTTPLRGNALDYTTSMAQANDVTSLAMNMTIPMPVTPTIPATYIVTSSSATWGYAVPVDTDAPAPPVHPYAQLREEERRADERAEALLTQLLSADQRAEYDLSRSFHVQTRSGRRYKVSWGRYQNVLEEDAEGHPKAEFCIHPRDAVPTADVLVAQLLLLSTNEREFRRIAHRFRLR